MRVRVRAPATAPLAALLLDGCALANCRPPPFKYIQVTFLHGLHLVDTPRALNEAHRLLKPHGKLVAAWNDRCGPWGRRVLACCSHARSSCASEMSPFPSLFPVPSYSTFSL